MNQPTHIGLYARSKLTTDTMRPNRWHAVFVESRQPDKPFVYGKDDEKVFIVLEECVYSLEPIDHYRNPVVFIDELALDEMESELRERLEERSANRLEVRRTSGLNQRWMDVSWNDYEFAIPSEAISNPKPESELMLEDMDRVQALLKAGAMIGVPLWVYDKANLSGILVDHFEDMGYCLLRPTAFDPYHAGNITISGGNSLSLDRARHAFVPEDMEIKEGMYVLPRGNLSPEKVTMICNDYIACTTVTGRGVTYIETAVRLLTREEQAEVDDALTPKPLTEERAIELLGPTLHDMILRFPGNIFTRGTVFQRLKMQLPKDADTGEKIMAFVMANPGELIESAKVWPVFDEGRTQRGWGAWINRVNSFAPPKPEVTEPADHEHVFIRVKGKRMNLEVQKTRVTEVFEGEIEIPYGTYKRGAAAIADWMHGVPFDTMKIIRESRRPSETYNDEDEEEFETLDHEMIPPYPEPARPTLESITFEDLELPQPIVTPALGQTLGAIEANANRRARAERGRALLDRMQEEAPAPILRVDPALDDFDRATEAVHRLHAQIALATALPAEDQPAIEERPTARELTELDRVIDRLQQRNRAEPVEDPNDEVPL